MIFLFRGHAAVQVAFKNCAPFINCITNFDETTRDDAEDLDLVMRMRNLLEYSLVYSDTAQQAVYGFFQKMKQLILMLILCIVILLIILNLSTTGLTYYQIQLLNRHQTISIEF